MRIPVPVLVASAAAALAALLPAVAAAQPMRKDGLWEMTMRMSAPVPSTVTTRQCTDSSHEKGGAAFRNNGPQAAGVDCKAGPVGPVPGGGWTYSSTCTMRGMTMATTGMARGDFKTGYHMESTTRMTPAPMPQMAETKMVMDAKWLGPCPADMKPGDVVMNGRKISRPPPR
jgi:hypothetical protein